MRHLAWLVALGSLLASPVLAQTVQNTVVELSATRSTSPPRIVFTWPVHPAATGYSIYRRLPGTTGWLSLATAPGAADTWTDSTVAVGQAYEYRFDKSNFPFARGHATAGIDVPAVHDRGTLILIVADNYAADLANELARLEQDLVGDGWRVIRHEVSPSAPVPEVKALVVTDYLADPATVKAVFLFGDIPVPYSGSAAWDGHSDHYGAWPCDGFYGEMSDVWTDNTINVTTASRLENRNIPGDGKYDQSTFASEVELMVGRVDLANMPAFASSERDLLKAYLDKNHAFRHKQVTFAERAVIDDNFGYFGGEAFAASAWRSFAPMFGAANSVAADYFTTLNTVSGPGYLWSYGCGGGSYTSAGGVGSTTDFTTSGNRNAFTILFGSYHGDWDSQNNFMRASLCSGSTLTCAWAGRPAWTFSSMALGETIGFATRLSQNDPTPQNGYGARGGHMALMGDPSLRMHIVAPPSDLTGSPDGSQLNLNWVASPDAVSGYHVYRANALAGPYQLLNAEPVAETSYADAAPLPNTNYYMVRATTLQTSASGTYANLSQGAFGAVTPALDVAHISADAGLRLRVIGRNPIQTSGEIEFRLPLAGHVRLVVLDAAGRRVRTLERGDLAAGTHRRSWDGRDESSRSVAPGVYLVHLATTGQTTAIKLAVVH